MSGSSWLKSCNRSEREETRWLQPAQAEPGVQRPWNRSNISAPIPHRASRSNRISRIRPSAIDPKTSRSRRPISNSSYANADSRRIFRHVQKHTQLRLGIARTSGKKRVRPNELERIFLQSREPLADRSASWKWSHRIEGPDAVHERLTESGRRVSEKAQLHWQPGGARSRPR
jgi:hypothetical protein